MLRRPFEPVYSTVIRTFEGFPGFVEEAVKV